MRQNRLVASALIVSCAAAAWAGPGDDALDGVWRASVAELGGKPFPDEVRKAIRLEVRGDRYTVTVGAQPDRGTCKANPSSQPKALDITGTDGPNKGRTILAIYERNGDTLRIGYDLSGKGRPAEFKSAPGTQLFLVEYKRQEP